jgi:WD40 repeat protein
VWSVATGECVQTLEGHSNGVNSAQFSPDGTNIVSASDDKTVRVLDGQ